MFIVAGAAAEEPAPRGTSSHRTGSGRDDGVHGGASAAPATLSAAEVDALAANFSCSDSFGGLLLGRGGGGSTSLADVRNASDAMRQSAYWLLPFVQRVSSVADAVHLAQLANVPLAAVVLPSFSPDYGKHKDRDPSKESANAAASTAPTPSATFTAAQPAASTATPTVHAASAASTAHTAPHAHSTPTAWASAVLTRLDTLAHAARNSSNAMTPAVSLDTCDLAASDSRLRFAAYASVIWGAQALVWQSLPSCAPIGSDAFALVGSVNSRLVQWAEPLFLSPPVGEAPRYAVTAVYSTSTLLLPPVQGVHAIPPSATATATVQAMASEMVAIELRNLTEPRPFGMNPPRLLLFLSTAVSATAGGAPVRDVLVTLHPSVVLSAPIEPDEFQGYATWPGRQDTPGIVPQFSGTEGCTLSWLGRRAPLRMPGGSAQLVSLQFVSKQVSKPRQAKRAMRSQQAP